MVVEIIAGVIVLILAIIGIAKLAKWKGGGGGGGKAVALNEKLLYSALEAVYNLDKGMAALEAHPEYFEAVLKSAKYASSLAGQASKNVQGHLRGVQKSVSEYAKRVNQRRAFTRAQLTRDFLYDARADDVTREEMIYRAHEFRESMEHMKKAFGAKLKN